MLLHRSIAKTDCARSSGDEDTRTVEFVASSGAPVQTFDGLEYLRVKGMDLKRFRKNPVILDGHSRASCDDVIGRASVRKSGGQLIASVTFASDEKSDRIYQKVREGILNAVSIGFSVDHENVRVLEDGEKDGEGDDEIRGPGVVLNRTCLHEISVVPVPADEDALRRELYQRALMNYPESKPAPEAASEASPEAKEIESGGSVDTDAEREAALDNTIASEAKQAEVQAVLDRVAAREVVHSEIRAICPSSLSDYLDGYLLESPDTTFDEARRALLDERARTHAPTGTTETKPTDTPAAENGSDLFESLTGR